MSGGHRYRDADSAIGSRRRRSVGCGTRWKWMHGHTSASMRDVHAKACTSDAHIYAHAHVQSEATMVNRHCMGNVRLKRFNFEVSD